jgi:FMN-dependent oxidoreductase (nitrilotriacetate monooxygenase family)
MMAASPFHLGWFGNFTVPAWNEPFAGNDRFTWVNGDFYIDMARSLERAGFDYFMIEDSLMVSDIYAGTAELELKHARYAPKHDPMALLPLLTKATQHLGVIATASATFYPPFMLARSMSTLDSLSGGRVGWNVVTSSEDRAAQNFGWDKLPEHDLRYDKAEEFIELVLQLWDSWAEDAVVMDREANVYADFKKVNPIHYEGKYHRSRGPLNTLRSPQGSPVICQAGGSPRGRDLSSKYADTLLAIPRGVPAMKAYRDDLRARAIGHGRSPDDVKVMFVVMPVLGATQREAEERLAMRNGALDHQLELALVNLAGTMEVDLSPYPLDDPLPEHITTNGHQSSLQMFLENNRGKTLREALSGWRVAESIELAGTPDAVAGQMDEIMQEVGGDGFLFFGQPVSRRYLTEICDGLAPALQRRGLTRSSYEHQTLRENLLAF